MFTGIVRQSGQLTVDPQPSGQGGVRFEIGHDEALSTILEIGASLAVSGVCLTVTEMTPGKTVVELSPETLARTTLGDLRRGSRLNLEPAMRLGEAMGGHWVQGHVDATTEVVERRDLEQHRELFFHLPEDLGPFVVEKGSVTIDGVSLTIASLYDDRFSVALIPHTLEVTTLSGLEVGDRVNLEVDILAKYVRRSLEVAGLTGIDLGLGAASALADAGPRESREDDAR